MTTMRVDVLGIGTWAVGLEGWQAMASVLRGEAVCAPIDASRASRPSPTILPAAERRRAPLSVAVALEVAREAVDMARGAHTIDSSALASVFASAYGDLAIVDYLCKTLAGDPGLLSPTRFHHSVHNAAAGYWSIATRDHGPASAVAAGNDTFAAGLLEAATQACSEDRPVLLVAFDTPAVRSLLLPIPSSTLFGLALVMAPAVPAGRRGLARLALSLHEGGVPFPVPRSSSLRALAASSPSARAIALAESIAESIAASSAKSAPRGRNRDVIYPLSGADSSLTIGVSPIHESHELASATRGVESAPESRERGR